MSLPKHFDHQYYRSPSQQQVSSSPQNSTEATINFNPVRSSPVPDNLMLDDGSFNNASSNHVNEVGEKIFKLVNVPGDGDCFFSCLSLAICGLQTNAHLFREFVCNHIVQHWGTYYHHVITFHDDNIHSIPQYKAYMIYQKGFATQLEIDVASELFHSNFKIWIKNTADNPIVPYLRSETDVPGAQNCINLHLVNSHFSLLISQNFHPAFLPVSGLTMLTIENTNPTRSTSGDPGKHSNNFQYGAKTTNTPHTGNANSNNLPDIQNANSRKRSVNLLNEFTSTPPKINKFDEPIPTSNAYPSVNEINSYDHTEYQYFLKCRKLGLDYFKPRDTETNFQRKVRRLKNSNRISRTEKKLGVKVEKLAQPPPLDNKSHFNKIADCIRNFELQQMSYDFNTCKICNETRLEMKMSSTSTVCSRCARDKSPIKMFSNENKMDPKTVPKELSNLTVVEQQLISAITPLMNIHMLKHGGIASNGHCVSFPQNVSEPATILPRLPKDIQIIRVRRKGVNDTTKEFNVRRYVVQDALHWLQQNNPAYQNIIISNERLSQLPENGPLELLTLDVDSEKGMPDHGPAPQQSDPGAVDGSSDSCFPLPDQNVDAREQVENILKDVIGPDHEPVKQGKKYISIPWPTQNNAPLSEFTTQHFFSLAFPCLFPYALGDFHINRPVTCTSMPDWVEHLMWYKDGRFATHRYFKFIVHNIIMRKKVLENTSFIVNQKLGDEHMTIDEIRDKVNNGDKSIIDKILYFSATLRGTSQYWNQKTKELNALHDYQISKKKGLPSFFTTGSCAEYHWKPLRQLLQKYIHSTTGKMPDLDNRNTLFQVLQQHTHIVSHYFDLRTQNYFNNVMKPAFGIDTYWVRMEFAKSRGMIHWHGFCWRTDRYPHQLIYDAIQRGLNINDAEIAKELSEWAKQELDMTANHPAGKNENGSSKKQFWCPPEGTAPTPPEEKNPLVKMFMDVSDSQENLLDDHLHLCNRVLMHRCSSYCLRTKGKEKKCRFEFGTENSPGKPLFESPEIVKDRNGNLRLEMERDHPRLVQHSIPYLQSWRANCDLSLMLSQSNPDNPSVQEIIAAQRYATAYACKGNEPTGAVHDLFQGIVNNDDQSDAKSCCMNLLMQTIKRDRSAMEVSYDLLQRPLYHCTEQFQTVSLSGSRVLEKSGKTFTKQTPLDRYLNRPIENTKSLWDYTIDSGKVPVVTGACNIATWPLQDDYCRSKMILHWPNWRQITDIKPENLSWVDAFNNFLQTDVCPCFVKAAVEKAKNPQADLENMMSQVSEDHDLEAPDWMQLMQPVQNFDLPNTDFTFDDGGLDHDWSLGKNKYDTLGLKWLDNLQVDDDHIKLNSTITVPTLQLLNTEQQFAFSLVLDTLLKYKNKSVDYKPLRLIVSGTAGSGKSFLIQCIVFAIQQLFSRSSAVQVVCPTGNSANLISGKTIHDFLKIPTSNTNREMSPPQASTLQSLQDNCRNLLVLLVDERSLVGATTLGWMEYHARHGLINMDNEWGGLPVVVFLGDDVQLPPVCDSPVFCSKGKSSASMHGALIWKNFTNVVELTTIVRQQSDQQRFKQVLMSLRNYSVSQEDATWLQNFQWSNLRQQFSTELLHDMAQNGLHVFPTHAMEFQHNMKQLLEANKSAPVAKLLATHKGSHAQQATSDKASGLLKQLHICVGAKVMLTSNLCVPYGLFNGAIGIVQDIIYLDGRSPSEHLPDVVMVNFSSYSGPDLLSQYPKVIPIVPIERKVDCYCKGCKRTQIPLRLGWGCTIHKCQGMTIGHGQPNRYIVIHPGSSSFESRNPGALFVALSRAKTAGNNTTPPDFAWHPDILINEDRICHRVQTPTTTARCKEIERLTRLGQNTKVEYQMEINITRFQNIIQIIQEHIDSEKINDSQISLDLPNDSLSQFSHGDDLSLSPEE